MLIQLCTQPLTSESAGAAVLRVKLAMSIWAEAAIGKFVLECLDTAAARVLSRRCAEGSGLQMRSSAAVVAWESCPQPFCPRLARSWRFAVPRPPPSGVVATERLPAAGVAAKVVATGNKIKG